MLLLRNQQGLHTITALGNAGGPAYDHASFSGYRLYTLVVNYPNDNAALSSEDTWKTIARAYLRYTDANGLVRYFYNNYDGTAVYWGGCCTSLGSLPVTISDN